MSVLGRFSLSMTNLSLLLYIQESTKSFPTAGVVVGVSLMGTAAAALLQGRSFDRRGVSRTLIPVSVTYVALTGLMVALVYLREPLALLAPVAFIHGLSVPVMSVATRAMHPHLAPEGPLRDALFRYWVVSSELCYVLAPALTGSLAVIAGWGDQQMTLSEALRGPFVVSAGLLAASSIGYAALPAIRNYRGEQARHGQSRTIYSRAGLTTLVFAALGYGATVGFVVITATQGAVALDKSWMIGSLFALMSVCSVAAGLLFPTNPTQRGRQVWMTLLLIVGAAALLIPMLGVSVGALIATVTVAGVTFAPQLALQTTLVDAVVPPDRSGVSVGWLATAIVIGNGGGQALGGILASQLSPASIGALGALVVATLAAIVFMRRETLTRSHVNG